MTRTHIPIPRPDKKTKVASRLTRGGRIKPVSATMARLRKIYQALSAKFLAEHPYCQHFMAEHRLNEAEVIKGGGFSNGYIVPLATEIHHKKGRGKYYLDVSTFMACRPGHSVYIHGFPEEAYKKGYMLPRND
jgi:hypothetical protein